ncbi:MAG TPA: extracellular solute-binding protein [Ignavibacteriaceae bacterium]|nr:extracellular solute-binding protein [Ignavibacteriaceae bacterium]
MKSFLKIIIITLFGVSLFSCSGSNKNSRDAIVYWCSNNNDEIQFAKIITEEWNKNNPNDKIKYQPVPEGRSSEEIILAAVVGKTTPDIYSNMWQGDVEAYAQAGVLVALDTLKGFLDFLYERCDSSVIEEIKSLDGHIYQIPWKINPIMLIYNVNLINDLKLQGPPKTYSEFFDASRKFQKDLNGDGYIDRWFGYSEVLVTWWQRFFDFYPLYLASSNGAPLVKDNKAVFDNKYAVGVFRFLQTLYERDYFPREQISARQDVFLSGVIASRFTGPWEIAHAEKFKPKGFKYEYTFMPVPDDHKGPIYTYGDPKNIVIFKTCKYPQAAWNYIKTMINNNGDLKLLEITNQLPRRKNLNKDPFFTSYFIKNPKMQIFAEQSKYVRGTDASPVLKEVFDLISQEYEACVVYGKKTPEQAIKDASDAVNLLFLK